MKKLLLLSITTFIIFSCDSSDDNDEGSENQNQNLYETVTLGTQTWAIEMLILKPIVMERLFHK